MNEHDGHTNPQTYHNYENQNREANSHNAFYGHVVHFDTCAYLYNVVQSQSDGARNYYSFERYQIGIEYDADVLDKRTTVTNDWTNRIHGLKAPTQDFSCEVTKVKYHPALKAIYYFLSQDTSTLTMKMDVNYANNHGADGDPCKVGEELFSDIDVSF